MSTSITDAKASGSSSDTNGAKGTGSPTVEELQVKLKEAQDSAETFRKSSESLKTDIESAKEEIAELNEKVRLTSEDRERKADLQDQIATDRKALAKRMRAQAEAGDKDAAAWVATAEAIAEEKFEEFRNKSSQDLTKRELEKDFEARDEFLEIQAAARSMSVEEFKKILNPHAKHYPSSTYTPLRQAKLAFDLLKEREGLSAEKAKLEEEKKQHQQFRDGGTGHEAGGAGASGKKDWSKPGAWRDAKTPQEQEQSLSRI